MKRYYEVDGCYDCPERWEYPNGRETCSATGKERALKLVDGIPKWCPLPTLEILVFIQSCTCE